jgi:hypothetical protein
MIGEELLAAKAVEYLLPYLGEAVKGAAGKLGETAVDGALKLLDYLKGKLSSEDEKAAIADLEAAPQDADNQADLRHRLKRALAADPEFREELETLLSKMPPPLTSQTMTITGSDNTSVQASGNNISITTGINRTS